MSPVSSAGFRAFGCFFDGIFLSFCNVIKYTTGAFCVFSENLVGFRIEANPTATLSRFSHGSSALFNLHALHSSAYTSDSEMDKAQSSGSFHFENIGRRIVTFCIGIIFFPLRALIMTITSCTMCLLSSLIMIFASFFLACIGVCMGLRLIFWILAVLTTGLFGSVLTSVFCMSLQMFRSIGACLLSFFTICVIPLL